ncbi:acetolactate synthase-1/2/3 large subunit [Rubricella aquisinus]|uniref:Acetolactate synthase-1/2/3 large subunit n=1 Tax=Rubricella aquisinus TaxID=2028108 RepID=A0A840WRT4_9RHOB|nr:thiamine pyrophosphate-dependent enzyme [Rubricella aquisinus]MBB5516372.1 acetolactate synthase-1/2/3 large subunit [Rubricella aquisinus]
MLAGHLLVKCLEVQGVERVFCVPGESYLAVLDGLHDAAIDVVNARHEGGAAMMAEADGKMTGRPGICMVTRGPGATNAAAGVHVAAQDSTPMILFVGQIGRDMRGREAFQEVDYRALFGGMAKWVEEIDRAERIPEIINHAWHVALSGRPGPVVIALPEDMLRDAVAAPPGPRVEVAAPAPAPDDAAKVAQMIAAAERPLLILGGSRWQQADRAKLTDFAEAFSLPVAVSFRRQDLFPQTHDHYVGDVGLGINPALKAQVAEADLVILLGARFSENPSQGFSLFGMPDPGRALIHIHPGAEELGRIYTPTLAINATPGRFLDAMKGQSAPKRDVPGRAAYLEWTAMPPAGVGQATMSHTIAVLREQLPEDAILTNGAGNYAIWLHRFWRYGADSQLAPTSGSMGYGMPAAVAAAARYPGREVVCLAGDGCFQMTGMEFGAAVERGLPLRVILCDNALYGTIKMHQARDYPARSVATRITNPDFAAWARSYGAVGVTVDRDADFAEALATARAADGPSLIHIRLDPRDIAPGRTIAETEL